jgi:hypothetical protein
MAQQPGRPGSSKIKRWNPQITVFVLLRIYFILIILFSSFILLCSRMINFLWENQMINFLYFDANIHEYITILLKGRKRKWDYFSVLNVGIYNSKKMTVFLARSWSGGPSAAPPRRQHRHILMFYISVQFINVYFTLKESLPFQIEILRKGFCHESSVRCHLSSKCPLMWIDFHFLL